mmetsp:Transcript_29113/g.36093  ORF Transcript_29113/g.36093 Transcript_29113/m.36093 type:complete len:81 (-) Transcript_29113:106-348(-)
MKLHKDNLPEQHFADLRHFLIKKHRQEAIAAKMSSRTGRSIIARAGRGAVNDDLVSTKAEREIMIEVGSELGSPTLKKQK